MHMFRHHHVSDHHKAVTLTGLFENLEEAVAGLGRIQQRQSLITGTGDKVQVVSAVGSMQARGHNKPMVPASYPPLQKAQGRGTRPCLATHGQFPVSNWETANIFLPFGGAAVSPLR